MTNYLGILFCPSSTTAYSTPGAIVSYFKSANVGRVTTNQLYRNSLLDRLRILGDYTYNSCLLGGSLGTGRCRYSGHSSWNSGCRWYWLAFQAKHCRIVLAGSWLGRECAVSETTLITSTGYSRRKNLKSVSVLIILIQTPLYIIGEVMLVYDITTNITN